MALSREDDPASRARLEKLRADLADRNEQLAALKERLDAATVPYELVHTVVGREPADHLVEVTEKAHASLLVIGLRRRTSVGKFLLGSSAWRIVSMLTGAPLLRATTPFT